MTQDEEKIQQFDNIQISPVMCVRCSTYAMAKLNGEPLCWKCLYSSVQNSTDGSLLDIIPLETLSNFNNQV